MFTNLDYQNEELRADTIAWGSWITRELELSGFRLDAMKHLPRSYVLEFIKRMQQKFGDDFFVVGEYWKWGHSPFLADIVQKMEGRCRLYDVQLCYNFSDYSVGKQKDLRRILEGSLVEVDAEHAVVSRPELRLYRTNPFDPHTKPRPLCPTMTLNRRNFSPCHSKRGFYLTHIVYCSCGPAHPYPVFSTAIFTESKGLNLNLLSSASQSLC